METKTGMLRVESIQGGRTDEPVGVVLTFATRDAANARALTPGLWMTVRQAEELHALLGHQLQEVRRLSPKAPTRQ